MMNDEEQPGRPGRAQLEVSCAPDWTGGKIQTGLQLGKSSGHALVLSSFGLLREIETNKRKRTFSRRDLLSPLRFGVGETQSQSVMMVRDQAQRSSQQRRRERLT